MVDSLVLGTMLAHVSLVGVFFSLLAGYVTLLDCFLPALVILIAFGIAPRSFFVTLGKAGDRFWN